MYLKAALGFVLGTLLSLYFVPIMRQAAIKWGVVDKPDGRLKNQTEPVAYLGGIAVYLSFILTLSLIYEFTPDVLGILLSGTIMVLLGLVDDFGVLTPAQKFLGQILATVALIKAGVVIDIEAFPYWLDLLLTAFWILGTVNALNIIDIMDGLSSGIAVVALLCLSVIAAINENSVMLVASLVLAGALVGFLKYNFHPAKIYLGDAGSMFIGLMLGALAMTGKYSSNGNPLGYIGPILILGVPIFDTAFVMLMRSWRGISPFLGSPDHFALRLKKRGWSVRQIVLFSWSAGAFLGMIAIWNIFLEPYTSVLVILWCNLLFLLSIYKFWKLDGP